MKEETLTAVQRAILDLLVPITDDPNCLGLMFCFAWRLEGSRLGVTGGNIPSSPEVEARMAEVLRLATDGKMASGERYTPAPIKRN